MYLYVRFLYYNQMDSNVGIAIAEKKWQLEEGSLMLHEKYMKMQKGDRQT
jgi:hypothetical protein